MYVTNWVLHLPAAAITSEDCACISAALGPLTVYLSANNGARFAAPRLALGIAVHFYVGVANTQPSTWPPPMYARGVDDLG